MFYQAKIMFFSEPIINNRVFRDYRSTVEQYNLPIIHFLLVFNKPNIVACCLLLAVYIVNNFYATVAQSI